MDINKCKLTATGPLSAVLAPSRVHIEQDIKFSSLLYKSFFSGSIATYPLPLQLGHSLFFSRLRFLSFVAIFILLFNFRLIV